MKKNAYTQIQKNKKVKVIEIKFEYRLNFNFDNLHTELLHLGSGVNKKKYTYNQLDLILILAWLCSQESWLRTSQKNCKCFNYSLKKKYLSTLMAIKIYFSIFLFNIILYCNILSALTEFGDKNALSVQEVLCILCILINGQDFLGIW